MNTINVSDSLQVGDIGFLTSAYNTTNGHEYKTVSASPGRKNLSGENVLRGWLGETNNVNRNALGAVRITSLKRGPYVGDPFFGTVVELDDTDAAVLALCERTSIANV